MNLPVWLGLCFLEVNLQPVLKQLGARVQVSQHRIQNKKQLSLADAEVAMWQAPTAIFTGQQQQLSPGRESLATCTAQIKGVNHSAGHSCCSAEQQCSNTTVTAMMSRCWRTSLQPGT